MVAARRQAALPAAQVLVAPLQAALPQAVRAPLVPPAALAHPVALVAPVVGMDGTFLSVRIPQVAGATKTIKPAFPNRPVILSKLGKNAIENDPATAGLFFEAMVMDQA